jgi:hypothetical protein
MANKPITYTATWEGKIVGTRKSPRPYKYAIIVQRDQEADRKYAYEFVPANKGSFDYYVQIATATPGVSLRPKGWNFDTSYDAGQIEEAKKHIEGGWEGFAARERQQKINRFEALLAKGGYEPFVHGWSQSLVNAAKAARAAETSYGLIYLGLVPAVAKTKSKS